MKCFWCLLCALLLTSLVGCGNAWSAGWGADEIVLVHNSIEDTIMTNLTMNGVPPDYGDNRYRPTITTGQEIQVPVRYATTGSTIELKFDVLDLNYRPLGIARTRISINRDGGYGPYARGNSPAIWNIRRFERFVPLERAGR